ncbi:MAG: dethiobiotin synthase [Rhodospirillaceae bacterium]
MPSFFVTATGTDIGKTYVTAGLVRACRRRNRAVSALKPVVSGFDPLSPESSDSYALMEALDLPSTSLERISPWRFAAPLSPDMAAARENRTIDLADVEGFCREAVATQETVFIEGVGGVMVPLTAKYTVLDWMAALRLPLILVTGSYLGTISHTLTALGVVVRRELHVACIVVNESDGSTVPLGETAECIARFSGGTTVATLPRRAKDADFDRLLGALI